MSFNKSLFFQLHRPHVRFQVLVNSAVVIFDSCSCMGGNISTSMLLTFTHTSGIAAFSIAPSSLECTAWKTQHKQATWHVGVKNSFSQELCDMRWKWWCRQLLRFKLSQLHWTFGTLIIIASKLTSLKSVSLLVWKYIITIQISNKVLVIRWCIN